MEWMKEHGISEVNITGGFAIIKFCTLPGEISEMQYPFVVCTEINSRKWIVYQRNLNRRYMLKKLPNGYILTEVDTEASEFEVEG